MQRSAADIRPDLPPEPSALAVEAATPATQPPAAPAAPAVAIRPDLWKFDVNGKAVPISAGEVLQ